MSWPPATGWGCRPWPCAPIPISMPRTCGKRTPRSGCRAAPPRTPTCAPTSWSTPRCGPARTPFIRGTASCRRTPASREPWWTRASPGSALPLRPSRRWATRSSPSGWPRPPGCRCWPRWTRPRSRLVTCRCSSRPLRAAAGAACASRGISAACAARSRRPGTRRRRRSATRLSSSSPSSRAVIMSRCRCWPTGTARCWCWANGSARSSGAIRRSSRSRPRRSPSGPPACGTGCRPPRSRWRAASGTPAPAPWSSSPRVTDGSGSWR